MLSYKYNEINGIRPVQGTPSRKIVTGPSGYSLAREARLCHEGDIAQIVIRHRHSILRHQIRVVNLVIYHNHTVTDVHPAACPASHCPGCCLRSPTMCKGSNDIEGSQLCHVEDGCDSRDEDVNEGEEVSVVMSYSDTVAGYEMPNEDTEHALSYFPVLQKMIN